MQIQKLLTKVSKFTIPALILGYLLGLITKKVEDQNALEIIYFFESLGTGWVFLLQFALLPFIIFQFLNIILKKSKNSMGRWSLQLSGVYICLILLAVTFAIVGGYILVPFIPDDLMPLESIEFLSVENNVERPPILEVGFWSWLRTFFISNPINAIYRSSFIPLIVFTVVFGFIIRFFAGKARQRLSEISNRLHELSFKLIQIILLFLPFGVLILTQVFTRQLGVNVSIFLIYYIIIETFLILAYTATLYPIMRIGSGFSYKKLQKSLSEGQVLALTSRSSVATLPSLIKGAKETLNIPDEISSFSFPTSASLLKVNRPVSVIFEFILLKMMLGQQLTIGELVGFSFFTILLMPTIAGVPASSGSQRSLPFFVYYGVPAVGYILLKSVNDIVDIPKTLSNTTGYMASTVLLFGFNKKTKK
jgi:Na+/H+-dicarboxylate symporter